MLPYFSDRPVVLQGLCHKGINQREFKGWISNYIYIKRGMYLFTHALLSLTMFVREPGVEYPSSTNGFQSLTASDVHDSLLS